MNVDFKRFVVKILGISLIFVLVGWLVFSLIIPEYYLSVLPYTLLFFFFVTILVHAYQLRLIKKDIAKFARINMLVTFIKLIIYSIFAISYIAFDSENALTFVICIMLLYIFFSFVEVTEIARISKRK